MSDTILNMAREKLATAYDFLYGMEKDAASWKKYIQRFGKKPSFEQVARQLDNIKQIDPLSVAGYTKVPSNTIPIRRNSVSYKEDLKNFLSNFYEGKSPSPVKPGLTAIRNQGLPDKKEIGREVLDHLLMMADPKKENFYRKMLRKESRGIPFTREEIRSLKNDVYATVTPGKKLFMDMAETGDKTISTKELLDRLSNNQENIFIRAGKGLPAAQSAAGAPGKTYFAPPNNNNVENTIRGESYYSKLLPDNDSYIGIIDREKAKKTMNPLSHFKNFLTTEHRARSAIADRLDKIIANNSNDAWEAVMDNSDLKKAFDSGILEFYKRNKGQGLWGSDTFSKVMPRMYNQNIIAPADTIGLNFKYNKNIRSLSFPGVRDGLIDIAERIENPIKAFNGAEVPTLTSQIGAHLPIAERERLNNIPDSAPANKNGFISGLFGKIRNYLGLS